MAIIAQHAPINHGDWARTNPRGMSDFFNSRGVYGKNIKRTERTASNLNNFYNDTKFVKLMSKFHTELTETFEYLDDVDPNELKLKFSHTCSKLLEFTPDKLSIELTYDKSLFFTFIKDNTTIFFERFLDYEDDEEVVFSVFEGKESKPGFSGSYEMAFLDLNEKLCPSSKRNFVFQDFELA